MRIRRTLVTVEVDNLKAGDRIGNHLVMEVFREISADFIDITLLSPNGDRTPARFPRGLVLETLQEDVEEDE